MSSSAIEGHRRLSSDLWLPTDPGGAEPEPEKRREASGQPQAGLPDPERTQPLLLTRAEPGPTRTHDGTVITLHPDRRWCSDVFEIACLSGERIRVAFGLDTCDREILSFVATTKGIDGEMIRDLMVQSLEARFGAKECLPHPIEWLSDNGSCYTAHETRRFGLELGFQMCTTPVKSPESNGMAESFVRTFKRDYVSLHPCSDALTVMKQLPQWFDDYNENHPHQGLKMRSPREFRRSYLLQQGCPIN